MCKSNQTPAAIEGSKLSVIGQDIKLAGPPRRLSGTGQMIFPLSVKKRGQSEIIAAFNPKEWRFRQYSFLDIGSSISGPTLWGFSSDPIGTDSVNVGGAGRTSSHSGQDIIITGTCFMEIVKGYCGDPLITHPKDIVLSVE